MVTNIIEQIRTFQDVNKSLIFLYPILQLPTFCLPLNSFMYINKVSGKSPKLLYLLFAQSQKDYDKIRSLIESHSQYVNVITENGFDTHVFSFEMYPTYYSQILAGQYDLIGISYQIILSRTKHPISEIAMNPSLYLKPFIHELDSHEEQFPTNAQLIEKPNIEKETLYIKVKEPSTFY